MQDDMAKKQDPTVEAFIGLHELPPWVVQESWTLLQLPKEHRVGGLDLQDPACLWRTTTWCA